MKLQTSFFKTTQKQPFLHLTIYIMYIFFSYLVIGSKAKAEICMNLAERLSENQINIQKLRDEISMIPSQAVEAIVKGRKLC